MNEDEYNATSVASVARSWASNLTHTIDFNDMVGESLTRMVPNLRATDFLAGLMRTASDDQRRRWNATITHSQREINSDFSTLNAHVLTAAWGAFESFVEDVCKAALGLDRSLLTRSELKNVKLDPSVLILDQDSQSELVLREAFNEEGSDLKIGVGKFESQLKFVNLASVSGDISDDLKDCIFYGQQFRNLWAHRAGTADKRFVDRCSALPYSEGQTVHISSKRVREFLAGLVVYGLLITNRFREQTGLEPYPWPLTESNPMFEDPYKQQWGHIPAATGWWVHPPLFERLNL